MEGSTADAVLSSLAEASVTHGEPPSGSTFYRTIWVSDIHMGLKNCNAEAFYDFLKNTEAEYLFLVGDVVDLWALRRKWHWPEVYNHIIRNILGKAKYGTEVRYIPGNHDEAFRGFPGVNVGNVMVQREYVHTLLDSRRMLVIHGDQFDGFVKRNRWLSVLGSTLYAGLLEINHVVNWMRSKLGLRYWSLSDYLKQRVKRVVQYVGNFEQSVAALARDRQVDGIVCGHIHRACIEQINGVLYCNDGDWVESCTALVEHLDGRLEIIRWLDRDLKDDQKLSSKKLEKEVCRDEASAIGV